MFQLCIFTIAIIFQLCIAQEKLPSSSSTIDNSKSFAITFDANKLQLSEEIDLQTVPSNIYDSHGRQMEKHAHPIRCYECNSARDADCITHPEKYEKNCTNANRGSGYIGCWKIDQWVDYDGDSEEIKKHHRVIRQCAFEGDKSKPCYYRAGFGGRVNACFCESALCNSIAPQVSSFFVILLSFLVSSLCRW